MPRRGATLHLADVLQRKHGAALVEVVPAPAADDCPAAFRLPEIDADFFPEPSLPASRCRPTMPRWLLEKSPPAE
jgi:hypothetical protein